MTEQVQIKYRTSFKSLSKQLSSNWESYIENPPCVSRFPVCLYTLYEMDTTYSFLILKGTQWDENYYYNHCLTWNFLLNWLSLV